MKLLILFAAAAMFTSCLDPRCDCQFERDMGALDGVDTMVQILKNNRVPVDDVSRIQMRNYVNSVGNSEAVSKH